MSQIVKTPVAQIVRDHWGENPPDYISVLANACEMADSQSKVAKRLGYSAAVVSSMLKNKYGGDIGKFEDKVRAILMIEDVDCPAVAQTIQLVTCLEHQGHVKAGNRSNSFRMKMMHHCPSCPQGRLLNPFLAQFFR